MANNMTLEQSFRALAEREPGKFIAPYQGAIICVREDGKYRRAAEFTQDDADAILAALGYWWFCQPFGVDEWEMQVWRRGATRYIQAGYHLSSKHACAVAATIAAISHYLETHK